MTPPPKAQVMTGERISVKGKEAGCFNPCGPFGMKVALTPRFSALDFSLIPCRCVLVFPSGLARYFLVLGRPVMLSHFLSYSRHLWLGGPGLRYDFNRKAASKPYLIPSDSSDLIVKLSPPLPPNAQG